ncbi:MAG TPA: SRPBCC family protein [Acidimicrobiales bacterium]
MAPITTSTEIDRSAEVVFTYVTDPARFSEWQKGVVDGAMDPPGVPNIGDRCLTTRRIGFANRTAIAEVVHVDPPTTWSVLGMDGPIRAAVDVVVEALSGTRARLTISVDFEGHGIGRLLLPLIVEREARTEMPANLATLKRRVQAEP